MRTNSTLGVIAIAAVLTLGMPHTARSAGEETGSFTAKIVGGVMYRPSNVGAVSMEVNMEGTVNSKRLGEGQASWTHYAQADVGAKTGTWRQYG